MGKIFRLSENNTTIKTEVVAGLTTFMAMAYVLMVVPNMFQAVDGVSYGAIYISTAIASVIGTVLVGLIANIPLAQAPAMGLLAFFIYTMCLSLGFTYANALVFVLAAGLIFVILTVTGLRELMIAAVPAAIKAALPAGLGLFIAFIGFQNSGLIVSDDSTGVSLASFNILNGVSWASIMPLIVVLGSTLLIGILAKRGVRGAVLFGVIGGTIGYYILGFTVPGFYNGFFDNFSFNPLPAFREFMDISFLAVFRDGFDFTYYLSIEGHTAGGLAIAFVTSILAFCMVNMFDTMGTLYGACHAGDLLIEKEDGEKVVPNLEKAMLADAIATCVGAILGNSTVSSYVEASSGIAAGGKTGLASMVTAVMFFAAMFLSPIAALVPACAYSAALIYVGVLMLACVKEIEWDDAAVAVPAFFTITMMPFTYNISYGIAFGLISYVIMKTATGKVKEVKLGTWVISVLFAIMFFLTH